MGSVMSKHKWNIRKDRTFIIANLAVVVLIALLILANMHLHFGSSAVAITHNNAPSYPDRASLKNLTYENLTSISTGKFYKTIEIYGIRSVAINLSASSATPGRNITLSVLYNGTFNFGVYNASAFLDRVVQLNYFGFYQKGAGDMLVYNNRPNVTDYFTISKTPYITTPQGYNPYNYTETIVNVTPTVNASGKQWMFCGGTFLVYSNYTDWPNVFNRLTYNRTDLSNSSVINYISRTCKELVVQ